MTIEYSDFIRFSGWPHEWQLGPDDEKQIRADIESFDNYILYLETKIKEVNGSKAA